MNGAQIWAGEWSVVVDRECIAYFSMLCLLFFLVLFVAHPTRAP